MQVTIYTKRNDPTTQQIKQYLRDRGHAFTEEFLNEDFSHEIVGDLYPGITYPGVVVDGWYVGGLNQLKEEMKDDPSQKLLNEGN